MADPVRSELLVDDIVRPERSAVGTVIADKIRIRPARGSVLVREVLECAKGDE